MSDEHQCQVVVGSQWGDEGKGKIVDVLADGVDIVARYQGGANAGHTVDLGGEEFILHQIPSGILRPAQRCLLGNGVVLDLEQFFRELDALHARGVPDPESRIGISGRAHLLLSHHKHLDRANETRRGKSKIGTTGRGIGPAYEDKIARRGVRVADLRHPDHARALLTEAVEHANDRLRAAGEPLVDPEQVIAEAMAARDRLLPRITDAGREVHDALRAGKRVLLEGAQGALLDVDHGTYPYVTSSNTTAAAAATGMGIGPTDIDAVLGVVKAYTTRVGSGPLPTELEEVAAERLRSLGGEYGATTGRPRRCGWFDAVVVRYAARVNGLTELAITKLDVLDAFDEVRIATAYEIDGERCDDFPDNLLDLERARPVFETLPGWSTSVADARSLDDLPDAARAYLERIQDLVGVPVRYVSVGTTREQIIHAE